jgi:predicted membrane channel-forming protein YqfA (hemolysin III family)
MTVLYGVLVVLHLLGMAGIVGGWMVAVRQPRILDAMVVGSLVSLVTGLLLVGLSYPVFDGDTVDNAKITVKLVVALTVAVLVWVNRNRDAVPQGPAARHRPAGRGQRGGRRAVGRPLPRLKPVLS